MLQTMKHFGVTGVLCVLVVAASGEEASNRQTETTGRNEDIWDQAALIADRFTSETYIGASGDTIPYRFLEPENYDSNQQYPLVVCLHGAAGRGRDNVRSIGGCKPAQVLSEPDKRSRYPSFLLVPQAPPGRSWGYSIDDGTTAERARLGRPTGEGIRPSVIALMKEIAENWSVDPTRIYVTGQSMGGGGAWHFAINHADLFAALLPITGIASPCYADSLVDIPVWAFHGALDNRVPVQSARDMVAAVNTAGGTARFTEFEGVGHNSWRHVFHDPDVLEWLFKQRRNEER